MDLKKLMFLKAAIGGSEVFVEKTATGNPVSFTTQIAKRVKSITVPLSYTQAGSGDPSPSNVRPITGVSSFTFTHNNSSIDVVFPAEPGTVYGGSLDLVSGVLTLTHQILVTTWGEGASPSVLTNNEKRSFEFSSACVAAGSTATGKCNIATWRWDFGDTVHFYNHQMYSYVFLPIETSDSTEIQIVGKLAEPITVQLDPHSIKAIKGTNTFSTDIAGDLTVKYYDKQ